MLLRLRRIVRIPRRLALVLEVLLTYLRVRRALGERDLRCVLRELRGSSQPWRAGDGDEVRRTAGRVGRVARETLSRLPIRSRCLTQSLVVTAMLARREIPSTVVIAVRHPGEAFGAHAWVESHGMAILPRVADGYARLVEL